MCHAPCCGTPDEMHKLMEAGYGERLMVDDWPDGPPMIKPAMKGYEGKISPWNTRSDEGCTFWKEGKCQLHSSGLKPLQGKLAHHSLEFNEISAIENAIVAAWETERASEVIDMWKKKYQNCIIRPETPV